jgi:lipopolysaccharide/colanic/teichoic acid biosynthesis glycosyltransferase
MSANGRTEREGNGMLKRAMDVIVAVLALVILSLPLVVIALLVVLDSPGPVFYRAQRVGYRGRPLRMLKFRKMHADATGGALTLAEDERFTRVGRWLVRGHLDELPQLWHVVRGEMSLVGPRPESPSFVAHYAEEYEVILQVRPGLTGYTQVAFARESAILDPEDPRGHYLNAVLPQKVALDRLYASHRSFLLDVKILIATALTVVGPPVAVNRATGALTLRRRPRRSNTDRPPAAGGPSSPDDVLTGDSACAPAHRRSA